MRSVVSLLVLAATGCIVKVPDPGDGKFACRDNADCAEAEGYHCENNFCVKNGSSPQGSACSAQNLSGSCDQGWTCTSQGVCEQTNCNPLCSFPNTCQAGICKFDGSACWTSSPNGGTRCPPGMVCNADRVCVNQMEDRCDAQQSCPADKPACNYYGTCSGQNPATCDPRASQPCGPGAYCKGYTLCEGGGSTCQSPMQTINYTDQLGTSKSECLKTCGTNGDCGSGNFCVDDPILNKSDTSTKVCRPSCSSPEDPNACTGAGSDLRCRFVHTSDNSWQHACVAAFDRDCSLGGPGQSGSVFPAWAAANACTSGGCTLSYGQQPRLLLGTTFLGQPIQAVRLVDPLVVVRVHAPPPSDAGTTKIIAVRIDGSGACSPYTPDTTVLPLRIAGPAAARGPTSRIALACHRNAAGDPCFGATGNAGDVVVMTAPVNLSSAQCFDFPPSASTGSVVIGASADSVNEVSLSSGHVGVTYTHNTSTMMTLSWYDAANPTFAIGVVSSRAGYAAKWRGKISLTKDYLFFVDTPTGGPELAHIFYSPVGTNSPAKLAEYALQSCELHASLNRTIIAQSATGGDCALAGTPSRSLRLLEPASGSDVSLGTITLSALTPRNDIFRFSGSVVAWGDYWSNGFAIRAIDRLNCNLNPSSTSWITLIDGSPLALCGNSNYIAKLDDFDIDSSEPGKLTVAFGVSCFDSGANFLENKVLVRILAPFANP